MAATQRHETVTRPDLEDLIRADIEYNAAVLGAISADPANGDAVAALHLNIARLEDLRREVSDARATEAVLGFAEQAGREAGRRETPARRRPRPRDRQDASLRAVRD